MTSYILRRLLLAIPVLFSISIIVFGALRLAPGDPALALAGADADGDTVNAIRIEYGLDRPIHEQYVTYMAHVLTLDFGRSVTTKVPVAEELAARYPITLVLALVPTVLATLIGVTFGVLAARFQKSWIDYGVMLLAIGGLSIPNYVLGLLLVIVFSVGLGWLPVLGASTPLHYLLPIITITAAGSATIARQTRSAMIEVLSEDYVRTARAKGLAESGILWRHALRNALIPVVTSVGLIFGHLMGGAVIVESVFAIPGLGKLMVDRIGTRDYPSVQGAILLIACGYVFVNILVDVAYVAIDKRVRLT